jgi:uncharacterized OB-fold protein
MSFLYRPQRMDISPLRFDDPAYLPVPQNLQGRALPAPSPEARSYWDGLRAGLLVLDHCRVCDSFTHYPVGYCRWCGGDPISHNKVPALGSLYTFTVPALSFGPSTEPPYVPVVIALDADPRVRLVSQAVNCSISELRIGMSMHGIFVSDEDRAQIFFTPR